MSWFESGKTKIRKSHIKNLISLAFSDAEIDKHELDLLVEISSRWGLTPIELGEIWQNPLKIKFMPPKTMEESVQQLLDLIFMMMIDGKIKEREMDFCKIIAPHLGFPPSAIDGIVNTVIDGINRDIKRDLLVKKIVSMN